MRVRSSLGWSCVRTLLGLAALCVGCGSATDSVSVEGLAVELPPAILDRVVFEGYRAGERAVEVLSDRATLDSTGRAATLEGVRIAFKDERRRVVEVWADRGRLDLAGEDFVLEGDVRGTTGEGERFTTAEVRYDHASKRLWTDRPVRIYRSNLMLEGEGMELDLESRRLRILGGVRTPLEGR